MPFLVHSLKPDCVITTSGEQSYFYGTIARCVGYVRGFSRKPTQEDLSLEYLRRCRAFIVSERNLGLLGRNLAKANLLASTIILFRQWVVPDLSVLPLIFMYFCPDIPPTQFSNFKCQCGILP